MASRLLPLPQVPESRSVVALIYVMNGEPSTFEVQAAHEALRFEAYNYNASQEPENDITQTSNDGVMFFAQSSTDQQEDKNPTRPPTSRPLVYLSTMSSSSRSQSSSTRSVDPPEMSTIPPKPSIVSISVCQNTPVIPSLRNRDDYLCIQVSHILAAENPKHHLQGTSQRL
jgi:hypothetical protein